MKAIVIALSLVICVAAVPKFHRVKNNAGPGLFAYQDIVVDEEENYVMITTMPGHNAKASVNLHDIATGFSAVKDINEGTCNIFQANHTLQELKDRVTQLDNELETSGMKAYSWTCEKDSMPTVFVRQLAGDKIAAFCEDYTSSLVDRTHTKLTVRSASTGPEQAYWCVFCWNINEVPC